MLDLTPMLPIGGGRHFLKRRGWGIGAKMTKASDASRKRFSTRRTLKRLHNRIMDLRFGGSYGVVRAPDPQSASFGSYGAAPTDHGALSLIFDGLVEPSDVFVDVGCGRGRAIRWWLSRGYKNKIIGIELDAEAARYAKAKLSDWNNVEIVHSNILENIPADGTLFYLYNPFNQSVLESFRDQIVRVFRAARPPILVYYNCKHVDVFRNDSRWDVEERDLRDASSNFARFFHRLAIIRLRSNAYG